MVLPLPNPFTVAGQRVGITQAFQLVGIRTGIAQAFGQVAQRIGIAESFGHVGVRTGCFPSPWPYPYRNRVAQHAPSANRFPVVCLFLDFAQPVAVLVQILDALEFLLYLGIFHQVVQVLQFSQGGHFAAREFVQFFVFG